MAALAKALVGGLVRGAGTGLVEKHERLREDALLRARQLRDDKILMDERNFIRERDEASRTFATERDAAQTEESRGLLQSTHVGEDRGVRGVTRGGEVIDLGFKAARTASGADTSGLPAGDQRLIDTAIERHTKEGAGLTGTDEVDWAAVADTLDRNGRPDLARLVAPAAGESSAVDPGSEQYLEAKARAEAEAASKMPGLSRLLPGDQTREAFDGLTREEWTTRRTDEIYRDRSGQGTGAGAPSGQDAGTAAGPAAPSAPSVPPRGAGTQQDPYEPSNQAEYDAIPSGAIYRSPEDGQLYTKG